MPRPLLEPPVAHVLDRLHRAARRDWRHVPRVLPYLLLSKMTGRSLMSVLTPSLFRRMYIPVSRQDGRLLYGLVRGTGARTVVEFGTSFGVSTLYLAAAVRANGGGRVITTELEESKCRTARANIRQAGLDDVVELREGDAVRTLRDVPGPVDLVFLDGWKDLYVQVLELVRPALRLRAIVVADNVNLADTRPYLDHIRSDGDFASVLLPGGRLECSWYLPMAAASGGAPGATR